ncbi:hypothetical protein [Anaerorhabdus sp.]|uniref:hypothetical protein n=1 Tax=Anaerorhabdus sp. TaxID=1872524 RepID=UPI002FCA9B2A
MKTEYLIYSLLIISVTLLWWMSGALSATRIYKKDIKQLCVVIAIFFLLHYIILRDVEAFYTMIKTIDSNQMSEALKQRLAIYDNLVVLWIPLLTLCLFGMGCLLLLDKYKDDKN